MMNQLNRWVQIEVEGDGVTNFGFACSVEHHHKDEEDWGFTINMQRVRHLT
jgi:hypothetical protein